MLVANIQNLVKVKLEEYSPYNPVNGGPLVGGGDVLDELKPIDAYIAEQIDEAANEVLLAIPTWRLNAESAVPSITLNSEDPFIGEIALPLDYLKLHTLKFECWKKPVHVTYKAGDYMDSRQYYKATRGSFVKPVVVEDNTNAPDSTRMNQAKKLRYYSTNGDHTVEIFRYVPKFGNVNLKTEYDSQVGELIALNCAKKICELFERGDAVTLIDKEMQSVMQSILQ